MASLQRIGFKAPRDPNLLDPDMLDPGMLATQRGAVRCRSNAKRGDALPVKCSYRPVESAQRVLRVLRALNALRSASVAELHAATGLSKPTVVRMLETLICEGYVA